MSTVAIPEVKTRPIPAGIKIGGLTFVLATLSWLGPFSIDSYLPSLLSIGHNLHASAAQTQQTMTAFLVAFAAMSLWHGAISDSYGRRRLTLICLGIFSIASLGCALAGSVQMLMFFRVLQGATAGAGMVVGRAVIRDVFDGAAAQRLMSHTMTIFAIAPVIAPVIGGWLQVWFGWRSIFLFLMVLSALLFASTYRYLPETLAYEKRQRLELAFLARSYWKVLKQPAFMTACISMACTSIGFFIYLLSAPVFLVKNLHLKETEFIYLYAPVSVAMISGAWISGYFAGKITGKQTVLLGYIIMVVAAIWNVAYNVFFPPILFWSIAPVFFYILGNCVAIPSLSLMTLDLFPNQRGLAASCQGFVSLGANSFVSAFVAFVWKTPLSLGLTQFCALIGGVAMIVVFMKVMKDPEKV
jgi:DHA1 family bicyclomycin/chloramphenicol resistance-like MFS transporter